MEPSPVLSPHVSDSTRSSFPSSEERPGRWRSFVTNFSRDSRKEFKKNLARWIRLVWLDLLAMFLALVTAYIFKSRVGVFRQNRRTFAMWRDGPDDWHGQTYISHPKQGLILNNLVAASVFVGGSLGIIAFIQIFVRNFWDAHTAVFGFMKALISMTLIQTTLKLIFGAFRPHFLFVCRPDPAMLRGLFAFYPEGFRGPVWVPVSVCRGDPLAIRAAMQSFPSGHTGSALSAGVYLTLYLNAKLKAFSDYQTSHWKMLVVLFPLIGAGCVAGLVVIDGNHHLRDVIFSMAIGAAVGVLAYRAQYRSAFRHAVNHLPLPYHCFTISHRDDDLAERWAGRKALAVRWPAR